MTPGKHRLTREERDAHVLALLRREGILRVATLAKAFAVTAETARPDLDELARSGALKRTYGGGASRSLTDELGIGIWSRAHGAERGLIGAAAAQAVEAGGVTSGLPAARALGTSANCRVVLFPAETPCRGAESRRRAGRPREGRRRADVAARAAEAASVAPQLPLSCARTSPPGFFALCTLT